MLIVANDDIPSHVLPYFKSFGTLRNNVYEVLDRFAPGAFTSMLLQFKKENAYINGDNWNTRELATRWFGTSIIPLYRSISDEVSEFVKVRHCACTSCIVITSDFVIRNRDNFHRKDEISLDLAIYEAVNDDNQAAWYTGSSRNNLSLTADSVFRLIRVVHQIKRDNDLMQQIAAVDLKELFGD